MCVNRGLVRKPWKDRYLDVDRTRVHFLEAGRGPILCLVHGARTWECAELTYGSAINHLSKQMHVIAPDTIGWGLTQARGPEDFIAHTQGDFLIQFFNKLGIENASFVGLSHGGFLVQHIAHKAPKLVRNLILVNSHSGTKPYPPTQEELDYIDGLRKM